MDAWLSHSASKPEYDGKVYKEEGSGQSARTTGGIELRNCNLNKSTESLPCYLTASSLHAQTTRKSLFVRQKPLHWPLRLVIGSRSVNAAPQRSIGDLGLPGHTG